MKNINTKKGFTIIEVVLVLAIAGLIFLMVFVALPSLQNSQKDTQRKSNYSLVATAMENYKSNNGGKIPSSWAGLKSYLGDDVADPENGTKYNTLSDTFVTLTTNETKTYTKSDTESSTGDVVTNKAPKIVTNAKCDTTTEGKVNYNSGARNYAIVGYLESGIYCQSY